MSGTPTKSPAALYHTGDSKVVIAVFYINMLKQLDSLEARWGLHSHFEGKSHQHTNTVTAPLGIRIMNEALTLCNLDLFCVREYVLLGPSALQIRI